MSLWHKERWLQCTLSVPLCISHSVTLYNQGYSETALIAAVRLGYENIARTLALNPGTQVDAVDSAGKSALQFAVETRRPGLVSLLLQAGAEIPPTLLQLLTHDRSRGHVTKLSNSDQDDEMSSKRLTKTFKESVKVNSVIETYC